MKHGLLGIIALSIVVVAGCAPHKPATTIFVRGGPSLLRVMDGVAAEFQRQHPDITVALDFTCPPCIIPTEARGSSNGPARVDVLMAVGDVDIQRLAKSGGLNPGPVSRMGTAKLALVVPRRGRVEIKGLGDLHNDAVRKIGLGDPATTDLGVFSVKALQRARLYAEVKPKFEYSKSGCDLLKSVALGIYDAAFVYDFCVVSDATSAEQVAVLSTKLYEPIPMNIVANRSSEVSAQAQQFVEFAASPAARPFLEKQGIGAP